jgi:CheY-like chemotaxis protein
VAAARSAGFDLILMDVRMPEIDGPTAARLIRSIPGQDASVPIVAFTTDIVGEPPPAWAGLFDAVLAKPLVSADLVSLLAERSPRRAGRGASDSRNLPATAT